MINWLKKYWLHLIVFGTVLAILMIDQNPAWTFMNKAADSIGYTYSAKYLFPAYHTSDPLFLLVGHFFLMIPIGSEAWRFALLSVICTMVACFFIYLVIKKSLTQKIIVPESKIVYEKPNHGTLWALFGVLIYGTSAMVISQSTIIETYPIVAMLAIGAYWFAINKKWYWVAIFLGASCAVHMLGVIVLIIFFCGFKEYRKNWKALLITVSFALFYLYIPLTAGKGEAMWIPKGANAISSVISDTLSTIKELVGTISIWDLPKRIIDTIGIIGLSVGIITVIPIIYYVTRNKFYKNVLFWLSVIPILFFISELDMNTFDYTMVAIPFLVVVSILGLHQLATKRFGKLLIVSTLVVIIGLGSFNAWYFNIGGNDDQHMSANELMTVEFAKLPSNAIFMPNWGWEWESIYLYNDEHYEHITPILEDDLNSPTYRTQIENAGIKLTVYTQFDESMNEKMMARSIIAENDNVWTTVTTAPKTFGSEVVEANHNVNLVPLPDEAIIKKNNALSIYNLTDYKIKPYNPFDVLETNLFEIEWSYVIVSNKNFLLLVEAGFLGFMIIYVPYRFGERRKKKEVKRSEKKENE